MSGESCCECSHQLRWGPIAQLYVDSPSLALRLKTLRTYQLLATLSPFAPCSFAPCFSHSPFSRPYFPAPLPSTCHNALQPEPIGELVCAGTVRRAHG